MVSHIPANIDTDTEFPLPQISDVTVELSEQSSKCIQSVDIVIDGNNVEGQLEQMGSSETAKRARVFVEPSRVETSLLVVVHLRYKNILKRSWRDREIMIQADELRVLLRQRGGRATLQRGDGKITVVVGLTTTLDPENISLRTIISEGFSSSDDQGRLTPTTEQLLRDCPRFRILVTGKVGVGKSSLINKTFGVDDAIVAHTQIGHADINREILSKSNAHFVLHDSKGFEHGDDFNVRTVYRFLKERNEAPLVRDKLHAIWLCIDIPTYNSRLLEAGVENFLKDKVKDKFGHVPVIVVFTKCDRLEDHLSLELQSSNQRDLPSDEFNRLLAETVNSKLQELCIKPFEKFVGHKVPWVVVSTEDGYEERLDELMQLTYRHVQDYFADAASAVARAQRVSPRVKILDSIAVGRRKYWERLATSVHFRRRAMEECLGVIHTDIIAVWQFNDPNRYLSSKEFKALISNMPPQLLGQQDSPPGLRGKLAAGVSLLAGIAGIVGALAGPQAPIVLPIVAAFVFGKWVYDVYQQTTNTLRHLMEYIIDLTLVLQNIFWLQVLLSPNRPLSRRQIKAAANSYLVSNTRQTLRFEIDKHIDTVKFDLGPDTTVATIIRLIKSSTIESGEAFGQRTDLSRFGNAFAEETYVEEWDSVASNY